MKTATPVEKETMRLEAVALIQEAYARLADAHRQLRDLGLHRTRFGNAQHSGHVVTVEAVLDDTLQAFTALEKVRFCGECGERAAHPCENCDGWFCDEHGKPGRDRREQELGLVARPSACDACERKGGR